MTIKDFLVILRGRAESAVILAVLDDMSRDAERASPPRHMLYATWDDSPLRDNELAVFLDRKGPPDLKFDIPGAGHGCLWVYPETYYVNHYQEYWMFDLKHSKFV